MQTALDIAVVTAADPQNRQRLEQIVSKSHRLLLPTRAECYGIVFCEANAYGLPVFATRVGGIPTIVKEGHKCSGFSKQDLYTASLLFAHCHLN